MNKCRCCFLVFLVTGTFYGCSSTPRLEFPFYGNFCGPGYPRADEKTPKNIKPADVVDAACQKHDLCYARIRHQNGTHNAPYTGMCDELLERELDHRSLSPACASLALDIKNWFRSVHPNSGVLRNIYKTTLGGPLFAAQYSTNLLGLGVRPPEGSCQYSKKYEQAWGGKRWVETSRYLPWVVMYVGEERRGQRLLRRKEMLTCREKRKLGIHYELGIGVPQNYQQARELYLKSYNCGIPAGFLRSQNCSEKYTSKAKELNVMSGLL